MSRITVHELKTDPIVFNDVWRGVKTFEIRYDDRDFRVGDDLRLRETRYSGAEMQAGKPLAYTGRELVLPVKYIMRGPQYGLNEGWVIMSVGA